MPELMTMPPSPSTSLEWRWKPFAALTVHEIYALLAARAAVFVLEQHCLYNDMDGLDLNAWHLFACSRPDAGDTSGLAACLRVLPPDTTDTDVRIGRVLTTANFRGIGLGNAILERALTHIASQWPNVPVRLHAQAHLQAFYGTFGFQAVSEVHDETGIPHVWMRSAQNASV